MVIESQDDVTRSVLAQMHRTPDPRTKEILAALVLADGSYSVEFSFVIEPGETRRPKAPISAKVAA